MENHASSPSWRGRIKESPWTWLAGITLLSVALVMAGQAVMPKGKMFPDYITYWTAGKLVASGQSPYDVDRQIEIQRTLGWDRSINGRGVLDFLPYYYPPWFALGCTLLVPLGFEGGKIAWFFLNLEMLFFSCFVLRDAVPGVPRSIALVAVPLCLFSVEALLAGQTTILILFLAALAWKLLDGHRDRAAGVALACLTTKPQLAAVLVLALGIWGVRQRRWSVFHGFAATLALLCLASSVVVPSWPMEMLSATRRTLPPTEYFPWLGNTWYLILRTLGLRSWSLWVLFLAVALPFLWAVVRTAINPARPLRDVIALGLLAAFFVAPYGRDYDFPVLWIPAFVLIGERLSEKAGAALLLGLIVIPYLQFILLVRYSRLIVPEVDFYIECTYFWVPALLATLWFVTDSRQRPSATE
ncbi:MAG: glycosyltransferase 87 family protein [Isosphaeraceae bacterium]